MKKMIAALLAVCLCVSIAGCAVSDYKKAMDLYEAGEYYQALEIYRTLGDYADSAAMAQICWQKADYQAAEAFYAAGDYRQALPLYQGLEMYMDSPTKAIRCQYEIGLACVNSGSYEESLSWLEPLGSYEDSIEQIRLAKWLWIYTTVQETAPVVEVNGGTLTLLAREEGGFEIRFEKDGTLLGVTYSNAFSLTFDRDSETGAFTANYDSTGSGQINEAAAGKIYLAQYTSESKLIPETFTQTIVDNEGVETVSTETKDALMMEGLLLELQSALSQGIPQLLEQTGLPLTVKDMGFTSLA